MAEDHRPPAAGNGLLDRRTLLQAGLGAVGALGMLHAGPARPDAAPRPPWSARPGRGMTPYGRPSDHEGGVVRTGISSQPGTDGSGASRTPLERLHGIITPSGLHFERHHSGVPDIDPNRHTLVVHGLVRRPLELTMADLDRYPTESRIQFLECSGNSGLLVAPEPPQQTCGELHGLVSGSNWCGVPLAAVLDEAGVAPEARWLVAEGADAALMTRSVPLTKALDDALLALYQNGERLRPENGYPLRLFLPGWEGNASVKWLRRIEVTRGPAMSREETSKYSDLEADGHARLFTFPMGVKSVITSPSPGVPLREPGIYELSGLAWSGAGRIAEVAVSADGGGTWATAVLDDPVLPKSLTRFRIGWRWNGGPATLLSRARDETGAEQPSRDRVLAGRAPGAFYHYNAIQAWRVAPGGAVANAYV